MKNDEEELELIDAFEDVSSSFYNGKKNIENVNTKEEKNIIEKNNILTVAVVLLPIFSLIYVISMHTNNLINKRISLFSFIVSLILLVLFVVGIVKELKSKRKMFIKILKFSISSVYVSIFVITGMLLYGDNSAVRNFIIEKAMKTTNHQYLATWFFDEKTINSTLEKLKEKTLPEVDVSDKIHFDNMDYDNELYSNKYEEQILKKDNPDDIYKIIEIEGTTIGANYKYRGYMVVVYDPSKVKIGVSQGAGIEEDSYGEKLSTIAKKNNALVAMNAGGFYDPFWNSNGGIPHGLVIQNGEIKSEFRRGLESGGLIGFNNNNELVLKQMTAEEALAAGIRDAVDWGPFLIVNGKNKYANINYYTWATSRTAIGQRKDGIVLLLVIDGGNQPDSYGASYADISKIMEEYGAINAANLDGGTSTALVENGEYVNNPWNGKKRTIRSLPNAWIVVE